MRLKLPWFTVTLTGNRLWAASTIPILLILLIIYLVFKNEPMDQRKWVTAETGELVTDLVESGDVRPVNSVDIKAPLVWGELQIMELIPEGTIVKPGDILVKFDPTTLQKRLELSLESLETRTAELKALDTDQASKYSELETNLKSSELSKQLAELKKESVKFESPLLQRQSDLEYQRQMLMLDEEQTRLKNQKVIDAASRKGVSMQLDQNKSRVEDIKRDIANLTLRATTGGMVVYNEIGGWGSPRKKVAVGDKPWPSQTIISIPDPSNMQVVSRVNEVDAARITLGDKASLSLDAFPKAKYTGTVTKIAKLADKRNSSSQIKDFEVTTVIAQPDSMLKPGMTAQVSIVLNRYKNVVYVPIGAVFEQKDGKPVIFKRKNPAKPVPVITGKRDDRYIIIAEGLAVDEDVSITPPATGEFFPLGRAREMERRARELNQLKATPDSVFTPTGNSFDTPKEDKSAQPKEIQGAPGSRQPEGGGSRREGRARPEGASAPAQK
jgi:HlyD family secretion protein